MSTSISISYLSAKESGFTNLWPINTFTSPFLIKHLELTFIIIIISQVTSAVFNISQIFALNIRYKKDPREGRER